MKSLPARILIVVLITGLICGATYLAVPDSSGPPRGPEAGAVEGAAEGERHGHHEGGSSAFEGVGELVKNGGIFAVAAVGTIGVRRWRRRPAS